jgi:uncharacterized protein
MESKILTLDLKKASDAGVFEGALSTYGGTPDRVGDVVQPGAFRKTLQESGGIVPLLLNHDPAKQVGVLQLSDSPNALVASGKFNLDSTLAKDAFSQLKFNLAHGLQAGMSIGYRTVKSFVKDGVKYLTELELFEGSLTMFPANPRATVQTVKRLGSPSEVNEMLAGFQRKLDAITCPRLTPQHQAMVDDFARKLDRAVRS